MRPTIARIDLKPREKQTIRPTDGYEFVFSSDINLWHNARNKRNNREAGEKMKQLRKKRNDKS